jgi:hypothetical protein
MNPNMMAKIIDPKDRRSPMLADANTVPHQVLDGIGVGGGAVSNAIDRAYSAALPVAPGLDGVRNAYGPPFTFPTGSICRLADWHLSVSAAPPVLTSTQ